MNKKFVVIASLVGGLATCLAVIAHIKKNKEV